MREERGERGREGGKESDVETDLVSVFLKAYSLERSTRTHPSKQNVLQQG